MRLALLLLLLAFPAWAEELVLSGTPTQGGLIYGQTAPEAIVKLDGVLMPVGDDGTFLLGFGRDAAPQAVLEVTLPHGESRSQTLTVTPRTWDIQRIDGLPPVQVTPDPAALKRIAEDNARIQHARLGVTRQPLFRFGYVLPAEGAISGVFGSQRILNGEPRSPHSGADIAAPLGAPVKAIADGVISLVHPDMFYTGQTVMIDHGLGLQSVYAHLSAVEVKLGQTVTKGQTIGKVGKSGRVTGPHLHFGVSLLSTKLDPLAVITPAP